MRISLVSGAPRQTIFPPEISDCRKMVSTAIKPRAATAFADFMLACCAAVLRARFGNISPAQISMSNPADASLSA